MGRGRLGADSHAIRLGEITGWGEHATEMKKEKAWKSNGEEKTQKTQLGFVRASKNSQGENKTEAGAASRDRVSLLPAGSVSVVSAKTARTVLGDGPACAGRQGAASSAPQL